MLKNNFIPCFNNCGLENMLFFHFKGLIINFNLNLLIGLYNQYHNKYPEEMREGKLFNNLIHQHINLLIYSVLLISCRSEDI